MLKQRRQVRIVQLVVDDETDVDRKRRALIIDGDGVAVPTRSQLAIVDGYRVSSGQGPGRGVAGNSRSYHRNPHCHPHRFMCEIRWVTAGVSVLAGGGGFRIPE